MTQTTLYLRAHVVMNSGDQETIYTEEVPLEIIVTDPCAAATGNILSNLISPIEYWIGDLALIVELGQGYWQDDASVNVMSTPDYCGLKFYELVESDQITVTTASHLSLSNRNAQLTSDHLKLTIDTADPLYATNSAVQFYIRVTFVDHLAGEVYFEPFTIEMRKCMVNSIDLTTSSPTLTYNVYTPVEVITYSGPSTVVDTSTLRSPASDCGYQVDFTAKWRTYEGTLVDLPSFITWDQVNSQFQIQTDSIDDLTTAERTYSIELTGSTTIADTNPVITQTTLITLSVENGCDQDTLSRGCKHQETYVYYIGIETDSSFSFPQSNVAEQKVYTAEWSNSIPGCPVDFRVEFFDQVTGSYRDLNSNEQEVVKLQNAISIDTSATFASQTFSSNQVELKIETSDFGLDLEMWNLKFYRVSTQSSVIQDDSIECMVQVSFRDVCWDLPIQQSPSIASPVTINLWEPTFLQFYPMIDAWSDFCDFYSYSFTYISGPYSGGMSADMSAIIIAQDTQMPIPTYLTTLTDSSWTEIGSQTGTHVLEIQGCLGDANGDRNSNFYSSNCASSQWTMVVNNLCFTTTFTPTYSVSALTNTVGADSVGTQYEVPTDSVSSTLGNLDGYDFCGERIHYLVDNFGNKIYPQSANNSVTFPPSEASYSFIEFLYFQSGDPDGQSPNPVYQVNVKTDSEDFEGVHVFKQMFQLVNYPSAGPFAIQSLTIEIDPCNVQSFDAPGDLTIEYVIGTTKKTIFYSAFQYPCSYRINYRANLISKGDSLENMTNDVDTPDFMIQAKYDGQMQIYSTKREDIGFYMFNVTMILDNLETVVNPTTPIDIISSTHFSITVEMQDAVGVTGQVIFNNNTAPFFIPEPTDVYAYIGEAFEHSFGEAHDYEIPDGQSVNVQIDIDIDSSFVEFDSNSNTILIEEGKTNDDSVKDTDIDITLTDDYSDDKAGITKYSIKLYLIEREINEILSDQEELVSESTQASTALLTESDLETERISPYFVDESDQTLTLWRVAPNRRLYYQLPATNVPDTVQIFLSSATQGNALADCDCFSLTRNSIKIALPEDWDRQITELTLLVSLINDGFTVDYLLPLAVTFSRYGIQKEQGPNIVERSPIQFLDISTYQDSPDFKDINNFELDSNDQICAPKYARTNNQGQIQLKFNHPIDFKYQESGLAQEMVELGIIQVQLVSAIRPERGTSTMYKWSLHLEDKHTMLCSVNFEEPSNISSHGVDHDQFRIFFVQTDSYLQCSADSRAGNRRRLDGENDVLLVPQNTVYTVELPPQVYNSGENRGEMELEGKQVITGALMLSVAASSLLVVPTEIINGAILSNQIIAHMPLLNVNFPLSEQKLMVQLNSITRLDFADPYEYCQIDFTETPAFNENFAWLDYKTSNFFETISFIAVLVALLCLRLLISAILILVLPRHGFKTLKGMMTVTMPRCSNIWIRFSLICYFEFLIACFTGINLNKLIFGEMTVADEIAQLSARICLALVCLFPVIIFSSIVMNTNQRRNAQLTTHNRILPSQNDKQLSSPKTKENLENPKAQVISMAKVTPTRFPQLAPLSVNHVDNEMPIISDLKELESKSNRERQRERRNFSHEKSPNFDVGDVETSQQVKVGSTDLNIPEHKSKYLNYSTDLFIGLRKDSNAALFMTLMHVVRRIILIVVAMQMHEQQWLQTICFMLQSIFACIYLLQIQPFADPVQNNIEAFNEICILMLGWHMAVVTGFNIPHFHRYCVGMSTVTIITCMNVITGVRWAYKIFNLARLYVLQYQIRSKHNYEMRMQRELNHRKKQAAEMTRMETERGLITQRTERRLEVIEEHPEKEMSVNDNELPDILRPIKRELFESLSTPSSEKRLIVKKKMEEDELSVDDQPQDDLEFEKATHEKYKCQLNGSLNASVETYDENCGTNQTSPVKLTDRPKTSPDMISSSIIDPQQNFDNHIQRHETIVHNLVSVQQNELWENNPTHHQAMYNVMKNRAKLDNRKKRPHKLDDYMKYN